MQIAHKPTSRAELPQVVIGTMICTFDGSKWRMIDGTLAPITQHRPLLDEKLNS